MKERYMEYLLNVNRTVSRINIFVMLAQLAQVPMPWKSHLQGVIQEHFLSQLIFMI